MPLYTADALVLRTYKLGEADRIVVFLTRDRGKKRGVAKGARRQRSRFVGALEPLTEVRVAYFEKERRELVGLNYAETVRSPLSLAASASGDAALTAAARYVELLRRAARRVGAGRRRRRAAVPAGRVDARRAGGGRAGRSRWRATSSTGCCGCRGCIPEARGTLSAGALGVPGRGARRCAPHDVGDGAGRTRAC